MTLRIDTITLRLFECVVIGRAQPIGPLHELVLVCPAIDLVDVERLAPKSLDDRGRNLIHATKATTIVQHHCSTVDDE
jgi:hypothetical protein